MALAARRISSSVVGGWRALRLANERQPAVGARCLSLPRPEATAAAAAANLFTRGNLISGRGISSTSARRDKVNMTFVEDDGTEIHVEAELGSTLLEVAHENDVELEGACGGDLACSTCHVVLPKEFYDKLDEKEEEEDDMLDLAWGLTDTSRLGCQIKVTRDLEGMLIKIPEDSMDMS
ncbi:unnamed protein product [Pylaiella littoralis]